MWGDDSYPVRLVRRFWIFVSGLALGYFRWRSNSTWLTVMVHSAINIFVSVPAGLNLRPVATSAIAIGIVIAAKIVCSVMICASSGASPPIWRAST